MDTKEYGQSTIMIVEGDPPNVQKIAAIVESFGYAVHCSPDGPECLGRALQIRPDLILIDATPFDSVGIDTCRKIKSDPGLASIPVVVMLSEMNSHILEDVCDSGASDVILAPLNDIELLWRIGLQLESRRNEGGAEETQELESALESAGKVCHKLNQPLQYVLGAVQILLMDTPPEDKMHKSLDTIREKVELMGAITRKLTEVTRHRT